MAVELEFMSDRLRYPALTSWARHLAGRTGRRRGCRARVGLVGVTGDQPLAFFDLCHGEGPESRSALDVERARTDREDVGGHRAGGIGRYRLGVVVDPAHFDLGVES